MQNNPAKARTFFVKVVAHSHWTHEVSSFIGDSVVARVQVSGMKALASEIDGLKKRNFVERSINDTRKM